MSGNYMLLLLIVWPIAAAILGYLIGRKRKFTRDIFAIAAVALELIMILCLWGFSLGIPFFRIEGFGGFGLFVKMDGFRFLYCTIAGFLWLMTTVFTREYLAHSRNRNRYYFFTLLTFSATLGVFLSADLFTTFLFFEIMSFSSYAWVVHNEEEQAFQAANSYLAIAVISGLVLLMGLTLLYSVTGTLQIDQLLESCKRAAMSGSLPKGKLYIAGILLLLGFGAKAGIVPLHFWLPKAHAAAPAPASALLSGILTKTGIFGIIVVTSNLFRFEAAWGQLVLILGLITMLAGAVLALFSIELKRILACSSVSQIGFILVGIGLQSSTLEWNAAAVRGTLLHMANHSMIKLVLFLVAGAIYLNLHELNLNAIKGFGKGKPLLHFSFLMGALGITGVPLWNGYISKTLLHEAIIEASERAVHLGGSNLLYVVAEVLFLFAGGLTVAYILKIYIAIFIDKPDKIIKPRHPAACLGRASSFVLFISALILPVVGSFPSIWMDPAASLGQDFFGFSGEVNQVAYFSFGNLKGAGISILIGITVYICFVRRFRVNDKNRGSFKYVDRWPKYLDLEKICYRPFIMRFLPWLFGKICNALDFLDPLIRLLQKGPFRKLSPPKKSIKQKLMHYASEGGQITRLISGSMAYGLLMICIGFCFTLIYLLLLLI